MLQQKQQLKELKAQEMNRMEKNKAAYLKDLREFIGKGESTGLYHNLNQGYSTNAFIPIKKSKEVFGKPITNMTMRELLQHQTKPEGDSKRVFAAGKYQIVPNTMLFLMQKMGVAKKVDDPKEGEEDVFKYRIKRDGKYVSEYYKVDDKNFLNAKYSPEMQDQLGNMLLLEKQPAIGKYIKGEGTLESAADALASEFASIPTSSGRGKYDAVGNNSATHTYDEVTTALKNAKKAYDKAPKDEKSYDVVKATKALYSTPVTEEAPLEAAPEQKEMPTPPAVTPTTALPSEPAQPKSEPSKDTLSISPLQEGSMSPAEISEPTPAKVSDILKKTTGQKYDTMQDTTPYLASSTGGNMAEDKKKDYILDPAFGKRQQERAAKKREELYKSIGEAYDTGKEYLGKGVDYVSDFFSPSEKERENMINYLKDKDPKKAKQLEEQAQKKKEESTVTEKPTITEDSQDKDFGPLAERKAEPVDMFARDGFSTVPKYPVPDITQEEVEAPEDAETVAAGEEEGEGEDKTQQVISMFKEVPNPIDTAKERNLVTEEFLNEIASAKEAYNQTRDEIAQRRLWDGITKGLAQIAIGLYGQKTGLDLSGIKFEPMDWQSQMDQATRDLVAARSFAKDTKDVKMDALDERRDQRLREIQATRQFNADAISMLELERRNRREKNSNLVAKIEKIEEQNMSVLSNIEDTEEYENYKKLESNLQRLYDKLPTVKKSKDQEEIIQRMRQYSMEMDEQVKGINRILGAREVDGTFGNAYPPEIFAPTKGWFGESTPSFKEISERSIKFLESGSKADIEEELSQLKQELLDAKGDRRVENAIKARIIELSKQR